MNEIVSIKVDDADTCENGIITTSSIIPGNYKIKVTGKSVFSVWFEIVSDLHYAGILYQRSREWLDKVSKQAA